MEDGRGGAVPEPIERIPGEALADLRGVVFDIDDTITRRGCLEADAFEALHRLHGAGLDLVAVTGRPLAWADVAAQLWPIDLAVGENGAGWSWRSERGLRTGYFQSDDERASGRELLDAVRDRVTTEMPHLRVTADDHLRRCDLAYDVGETVDLPRHEIDALERLIEDAGAHASVSSVHAHAAPGDWDKASGVEAAAREVLGFELAEIRSRWLFVGDSGNDAAAFAYFPVSVGVRNVERHLHRLPVPPRYVTRSDRGRGFREVADLVLASRSGRPPTRSAARSGDMTTDERSDSDD